MTICYLFNICHNIIKIGNLLWRCFLHVSKLPRQFINWMQQRLAYSKHNALVDIGSSNGLAPDMHHAIAWTMSGSIRY